MKRRNFVFLLGSAFVVLPRVSRAQQPRPIIGFLSSRSAGESAAVVAAFLQGLKEGGYVEGQNLPIEYRWAEGRYDRLPTLAAELVDRHAAVIVAVGGEPSALAAKAVTSTIPIVLPSRPGEFHPEPLTDPDVILSHHPARAPERRPPPSVEK